MSADPLEVYRYVLALAGIGVVISAAEYWTRAEDFEEGGPFAWRIVSLREDVPATLARVVGRIPAARAVRALLVIRIAGLLVALATQPGTALFATGCGALVATDLALYWRRTGFGADGSDQMTSVVVLTTFLCAAITATPITLQAGLWFIAAQGCLSYFAAGIAKTISPTWRGGSAVALIFSTHAYGTAGISRQLEAHRLWSPTLSWTAMVAETLFPLCLFLPQPWPWLFLCWGALFHLTCAVVMGLNTFFWAFIATYPAILYTASQISPAIQQWLSGLGPT